MSIRSSIMVSLMLVPILCSGCTSPMILPGATSLSSLLDKSPGRFGPKKTSDICLVTADELAGSGHLKEAVLLYEKARANNPKTKGVAAQLAILYDQLGNHTKAEAEFKIALQESPQDVDLLNDFGYFYLRHGNLKEAESWLNKALEKDPEHKRAQSNLAVTKARRGDYVGSLDAFSTSVGRAAAHSNLGILLAQEGKSDEANVQLNQALEIDPNMSQAKAFLAHLQGE